MNIYCGWFRVRNRKSHGAPEVVPFRVEASTIAEAERMQQDKLHAEGFETGFGHSITFVQEV